MSTTKHEYVECRRLDPECFSRLDHCGICSEPRRHTSHSNLPRGEDTKHEGSHPTMDAIKAVEHLLLPFRHYADGVVLVGLHNEHVAEAYKVGFADASNLYAQLQEARAEIDQFRKACDMNSAENAEVAADLRRKESEARSEIATLNKANWLLTRRTEILAEAVLGLHLKLGVPFTYSVDAIQKVAKDRAEAEWDAEHREAK